MVGIRRACRRQSSRLNISKTTGNRRLVSWLLLEGYRKVGGQNRMVTSLVTSRDLMTS